MRTVSTTLLFVAVLVAGLPVVQAETEGKPVDIITAIQAESELMFNNAIERAGGVNRFDHGREPATPKTQKIVRSQSDMLYSHGVFDASEELTVVMPEQMTGYQSVHIFDASHAQVAVVYAGETRTIGPEEVSTSGKHVYIMMRTSTDRGLEVANNAQGLVKIEAKSSTPYTGPGFDQAQLEHAKRVLAGAVPAGLVKAKTAYADEVIPDSVMLKDASDIEQYYYITSNLLGWGLMPNEHAYYPQLGIKDNNGGCTAVNFPKPPVQYDNGGYWSFTAYGMDGYLRTEASVISAYEATPNEDESFTVYVGDGSECEGNNRVDMPQGGASITLRLYRPTSIEEAKEFEAKLSEINRGK